MKTPAKPEPTSDRTDIFPDSRWSLVIRAQGDNESVAQRALNSLCEIYWYPIYAYIRRSGRLPEDAEDLTQAYFASLLDRDYLAQASREKGKLRAFLLTDLKLFLANDWRKNQAAKRGGGQVFVPIDRQWAEDHYTHEPSSDVSPADLFDRRWALALLNRVMETVRRDYVERGREDLFDALKPYLAWNGGEEGYAAVAARLAPDADGNSRTDTYVRKNVQRLRQTYRKALEEEVAHTVQSPDEVASEIRHLAASLC